MKIIEGTCHCAKAKVKCESRGAEVRVRVREGEVVRGRCGEGEGGVTQQMRLVWQGLKPETSIFLPRILSF